MVFEDKFNNGVFEKKNNLEKNLCPNGKPMGY